MANAVDVERLGQAVEAFLQAWRRGEAPPVETYAARHPHLAPQLGEALAALVLLEELAQGGDGVYPGALPSAEE